MKFLFGAEESRSKSLLRVVWNWWRIKVTISATMLVSDSVYVESDTRE
jgi:hypothetical protein